MYQRNQFGPTTEHSSSSRWESSQTQPEPQSLADKQLKYPTDRRKPAHPIWVLLSLAPRPSEPKPSHWLLRLAYLFAAASVVLLVLSASTTLWGHEQQQPLEIQMEWPRVADGELDQLTYSEQVHQSVRSWPRRKRSTSGKTSAPSDRTAPRATLTGSGAESEELQLEPLKFEPKREKKIQAKGQMQAKVPQKPQGKASEQSSLPELTYRQSSTTGRPRVNLTWQESQWIPIVSRPVGASFKPEDARKPLAMSPSAHTFELNELNTNRYSQPYNRQPARRAPNWHHQSQNRRPRVQGATSASKVYKRVLLCDKTLVSLDYARHFESEPRPHYPVETNDLDSDNLVEFDLDKDMESMNSDRRHSLSSSNSTNYLLDEMAAETSSLRRSYLTDEDPLVECDMWDLEKGSKNRKPPREILRMAVRANFDTVRDAINRCRQLSERTIPPDDEYRDGIEIMTSEDLASLFSINRGLIPGTKWCGLGDQASSYNDLGPKQRIDICCRAHDHCPIRLKPFRNDYGVLNFGLYTKSHCDCDADFYRCLREVHSRTADMLGNLYFNVMKLQCMREERLKICRELRPIALGFERCVRYEESLEKSVFRFTAPPVAY